MNKITFLFSVLVGMCISQVKAQETCAAPTNLSILEVTTQAVFVWDAPATTPNFYEWILVEEGGDPNNPEDVEATNTVPYLFAIATGLDGGTTYEFYVRSVCGAENSTWAGPTTFTTLGVGYTCETASPIYSLPYAISSNTSNYGNNYQDEDFACAFDFMDGNEVVYALEPSTDGFVEVKLSDLDNTHAAITVLDDCVGSSSACLAFQANNTDEDRILEVFLEAGNTYYIIVSSGGEVESVGYTLEVTNISCPKPVSLTASNLTDVSANINWTGIGDEVAWNIVYGEAGFDMETEGTSMLDNDGTAGETIMGLTAGQDYEFYVQADCGTETSAWAGPFSFSTTAVAPIMVSEENPIIDESYCYGNEEFNHWVYASEDGSPLVINFDSGTLEAGTTDTMDDLIVYDGDQVLFNSDTDGNDLSGLSFEAYSGIIQISIETNESISCEDDSQTALLYDVSVMECQSPTNLSASSWGADDIQLVWDAVSTAVGYEYIVVESGMDPNVLSNQIAAGSTAQESIVFEDLASEVEYTFYVRIECVEDFFGDWEMVSFGNMEVKERSLKEFSFYPNPVENLLHLESVNTIDSYQLYNMLGQEIINRKLEAKTTQINMNTLQPGLYLLKVSVGNTTETYRVVKK